MDTVLLQINYVTWSPDSKTIAFTLRRCGAELRWVCFARLPFLMVHAVLQLPHRLPPVHMALRHSILNQMQRGRGRGPAAGAAGAVGRGHGHRPGAPPAGPPPQLHL